MKNQKETLWPIVVRVGYLSIFWSFNYFAYGVPGVIISCDDDNFIGFSYTNMPPAMVACPFNCNANISIRTEGNEVICVNYARGCSINRVLVPCKELENYAGENLFIEYLVQNGETKTEEIQYNK